MTRVLVEYQKHGTVYWDATGNRLFDVALRILAQRVEYGYIQTPERLQAQLASYGEPEYTQVEVHAMRDGGVKSFAQKQIDVARKLRADFAEQIDHANMARRAIETGDGKLAWRLLRERSDGEYERVELEELIDPLETDADASAALNAVEQPSCQK